MVRSGEWINHKRFCLNKKVNCRKAQLSVMLLDINVAGLGTLHIAAWIPRNCGWCLRRQQRFTYRIEFCCIATSLRIEALSYFHCCQKEKKNRIWGSLAVVKDKCSTKLQIMPSLCCPAYPYLFLQLKFIQLSSKRIIMSKSVHWNGLSCFLLCWAPLLQVCWDRLSESSIVKGWPLCENENKTPKK